MVCRDKSINGLLQETRWELTDVIKALQGILAQVENLSHETPSEEFELLSTTVPDLSPIIWNLDACYYQRLDEGE